MTYAKGDRVEWHWGKGTGRGRITRVHTRRITRTIKGAQITRNATADEPAYSIEQSDGDEVLKSHTEIRKTG